ncbi:uncharacterized mitochondrial protein AtMg00810-like [Mangifera indica]|uniref:uncharacterized mitochondrial protein AtMg00810-like n=1 Tax=Mangifera indica TaxID=29780 RepID=UPI001CFBB84E|nr:uncharacterized mitochondrial protein AtMg00810-like [Mangifera indica]
MDTSLFLYNKEGKVIYVLVYVDDILLTGNDSDLVKCLVQHLNEKFALKVLGSLHYFLGFEVIRSVTGLHLNQTKYAQDLLTRAKMVDAKPCTTSFATSSRLTLDDSPAFDDPSLYRSIVGALQYLTLSRPDIAFSVNKLSQFLQKPTLTHWQACKSVLKYIKGTMSFGLQFISRSMLQLNCFSDADWASSLHDRRSTTGYCLFLGPNLIQWSSKKQNVVALSSTEA